MTFLTSFALAIALLAGVPYLAHRLRRRRSDEQPFPPARLVPPAPPQARRRGRLEDRALFATRAAAVAALAVLGGTPLLRCSRLSLQRSGGASVAMALVVDDSMSMRVRAGNKSRFDRARDGARELVASAREGDSVAILLAGAPARVQLAATTDLRAARDVVDALAQTDRGTDLEGALVLAGGLVASLPQLDRRVVVLSDLADGHPNAPPLGDASAVPVWNALPELSVAAADCAVMSAERRGARVHVVVMCGPGQSAAGRDVLVEGTDKKMLAHASLAPGSSAEVNLALSTDDADPVLARLSGADAIAEDDVAPVVREAARGAIAVIADATDEAVATGGAPIAEQALSALKLDVDIKPIPALPDRVEDLAGHLGVLLDDPPGLTPEQRHALAAYLGGGGAVLLALGPHAAAAPLGATLEPILTRPVSWIQTAPAGADPASALGELAGSAKSLMDLGASRRANLAPEDMSVLEPLLKWMDGGPLVARRAVGRGEAWLATLPFSIEASDLPLRPAFLSLLDGWVRMAREHAAPRRTDVGTTWTFPGAHDVRVEGPASLIPATSRSDGVVHLTPSLVGAYRITVDGRAETRVAAPDARELDLRPRAAAPTAGGAALGERRAYVDVTGQVALALLGLMALEIGLRVWSRRPMDGG